MPWHHWRYATHTIRIGGTTMSEAITAHRIVMPVTRPNGSWLTVAAGTVASVERTHYFFTLPSQRERFDRAGAVLGWFEAGEVVLDWTATKNRPADVEVVFIAGFYATDLY